MSAETHLYKELIIGLKSGDEIAYSSLYDYYGAVLYGTILQVIPERDIAQAILVKVFVKIFETIIYDDSMKDRFFSWLLKIARDLANDKSHSKAYRSNHIIYLDVNGRDEFEVFAVKPDNIGINSVLVSLGDNKKIVDLAFFNEYTQSQIAEEFNLSLCAVNTTVRTALIQLRQVLNRR